MGIRLPATRANEADPVVLTDPATGDLLGTAANPLVVSSGGSVSGDVAVHGVDATGAAPTVDPVFIAGIDTNGHVAPIKTVSGLIQSISEQMQGQPVGVYGTVVVGMDPGGSALPFLCDDEGTLFVRVQGARFQSETTTPLLASATFNGASRDVGVPAGQLASFSYFNGFFLADQIGTASIQCSDNGTTWTTVATDAIAANTPLILQVPVTAQFHRVVLENGGTAQTTVSVRSGYSST